MKARKARGCELALEYHTQITVEGKMPGGAFNKVQVNLSDVVPFIVMKGMALYGRLNEKDAWDIYFCVRNHKGGIEGLAKEFEPVLENKLVQEGLGKIRAKFKTIDSIGPTSIVAFEEITEKEERDRLQRDSFEQVNALLEILKIQPFA